MAKIDWRSSADIGSRSYRCGHCGTDIASTIGYLGVHRTGHRSQVYICHKCEKPTFFDMYDDQVPGFPFGNPVMEISDPRVLSLYEEARRCTSANAHTAAVLCSRKLLMNIAVSKGAPEGLKFIEYVEFLANKGFVPPGGIDWVDHIRTKGNEATHEITIMKREDAEELIGFSEMLLKFIFEFPARVKKKKP